MQIPEKEKWLFLYALPCHFGKIERYEQMKASGNFKPASKLKENFSRESVRNYFLGEHNSESYNNAISDERWFHHMLMPYRVTKVSPEIEIKLVEDFEKRFFMPEKYKQKKLSKRQQKRMKQFGFLDGGNLGKGDIIYIHGGFIVDLERCQK